MEELFLSSKIFSGPEMIPTRFGYGDGLVELGKNNAAVVVLGADLSSSLCVDRFREAYPDRFIQTGIAEQDMMALAACLALSGKIPFVSTYGVFCTGRAWDQLRTTVAYARLNVKVGSGHGGVSVGADGATHQALEDISITRTIPNVTVIAPADYHETLKATVAAASISGPVVIRFGREKVPVITTDKTPFTVEKAEVYKDGTDVTITACGQMVYESLLAAETLAKDGVSARVINCHTIKPIDSKTLIRAAEETGAVVTAEEHQVMGGFGSAVAEVLSQNYPVPMRMIGVQDTFGQSGDPDDLMEEYGLRSESIVKAAFEALKMKKG